MNNFWKDKQVTAYIALKHHTRFIIPVMENIAKQGAKTEYLVAQAERSQEITAIETNLAYTHVFDFLNASDKTEIYENYHILRKNFARAILKDKAFNLQMTTVLDKTLFATAQEYIGFKNYLKQRKPDLCIVLHELNRWGKMLSFHAKKYNIPLISFQEGLYTTATAYYDFNMTGHAQYCTFNLVWGERTRKKLSEFEAPREKIISAGNTHITDEINRIKQGKIRSKKRKELNCSNSFVVLLLFSIELKPVAELMPLFKIFTKKQRLTLFIKFHPAVTQASIEKWIKEIPKGTREKIHFIHGEENTYNLIAVSDLCVLSEGSTTGLEALAFGKPLVELQLQAPVKYDFSLANENAAIEMTPEALAKAIESNQNFPAMMDQKGVQNYLKSELHESDNSIENVTQFMQSAIEANQFPYPEALASETSSDMEWSIVLPVSDNPETFLAILEAIATYSDREQYEVILIQKKTISKSTDKILKSLEGDVSILSMEKNKNLPEMFNIAAINARGRNLIFLDKNIAPKANWLQPLKKQFLQFQDKKILGGKILNRFNNIVHAGMVVDANSCPVSAYAHLDKNFPHTCKTRTFKMLNHFIGINKDLFLSLGGFNTLAGRYLFMDICLRASAITHDKEIAIYIHDTELIQTAAKKPTDEYHDSIFFYSKWHGDLWENEKELYEKDGVSSLQLTAARMTRAIETASLT